MVKLGYIRKIFLRIIWSLFFVVFFISGLSAQKRCGTEEVEAIRRVNNKYVPSIKEFEKWMHLELQKAPDNQVLLKTNDVDDPPRLIPVVVHVLHKGEAIGTGSNLSDNQILSQIDVLNEDFQRHNTDTVLTQEQFKPIAGRMNVTFVLAKSDPDGNPTSGIVRIRGSRDSWDPYQRELICAESYWPAEDYLNIWVCDLERNFLGISQYPDINLPGLGDEDTDNRLTDGIIIDYSVFGSIIKDPEADLLPLYDRGRTTTHELGHFFGLRHVWGDSDVCGPDDYVDDTPQSNENYNAQCPVTARSCDSDDMFENYLYYTKDACMNAFTIEQINRMEVVLTNAPRRNSLINASGINPPSGEFYDLAISDLVLPGVVNCASNTEVVVKVQNLGTITAKNFTLHYKTYELSGAFDYQGDSLKSGQIIEITAGQLPMTAGDYKLDLELEITDDEVDVNPGNNVLSHRFSVNNSRDFIPYRERFDDLNLSDTEWVVINENDDITWQIKTAPSNEQGNTSAYINLYDYTKLLAKDWLISPALDFSGAHNASIFFNTSYGRRTGRNDVLQVLVSDNCGQSFDYLVYTLSSQDMSNVISDNPWVPTGGDDWKEFSVDLQPFAGMSDIRIAFVSVNQHGNNLYLDNIELFTDKKEDVKRLDENSFMLYPNPAEGTFSLTLYLSEREDIEVTVFNDKGRKIYHNTFIDALNQTYNFDMNGKASGLYFVRLSGKHSTSTKKLLLMR